MTDTQSTTPKVSCLPERFGLGLILALVTVLGVMIGAQIWKNRILTEDTSIDYNKFYPPLAAQIKQAQSVVLYEGLPHQIFEKDSLDRELDTKQTVEIHQYPFYREPLPLTKEDATTLITLFCDGKTIKPDSAYVSMGYRTQNPDGSFTTAGRACGGFHPDYCIEWHVNGKQFYMQVCFGCCMVKIFGPEGALRCDIDSSDDGPLGKVLRHYHKNRPARSSR